MDLGETSTKAWRYTLILLVCIFSTQAAIAAIIKNLHVVTESAFGWTAFYYIISFFAAIPQAGLSDESGRKKHLLIASYCVLAAVAFLLLAIFLKTNMQVINLPYLALAALTVFLSCSLLALTGNTIPIARGFLSVLKFHDFRLSIGLSTACIDLGWITMDLLSLKLSPMNVLLVAIAFQLIVILVITRFLGFKESLGSVNTRVSSIAYRSYTWCIGMLFVAGGGAAFLAYLFSETAFYQLYTLDVLPQTILREKISGIGMGTAYLIGIFALWLVNPSDKKSIKFGVIFSFLSILTYYVLDTYNVLTPTHPSFKSYILYFKGALQFLFAFGFGFSVPALFSLMSSKVHPDHKGRLFGAVDATDTVAFASTDILLGKFLRQNGNSLILNSIVFGLLILSTICYHNFIKLFKSYERD